MSNTQPDVLKLKRNLEALGVRSRRAIEHVISAVAREDVAVDIASDGGTSVVVGRDAEKRQLSSRRAPREEAVRLCDTVNVRAAATVVVSGFGSGTHIVELAKRVRKTGLVVCFEPDAALLRAVLERVDYSEAFSAANVVLITDAEDRGAIADALSGFEGALAAGVTMMRHPPSASMLGERAGKFEITFTEVMKAVRTAVLTTLVQVDTTVRNLLQNIGPYSTCDGIAELKDIAKGRAAIVVSAGPSLRRNIDLLKNPENRDKCVVIAVQTVLKTLLKEGIRPDFVTALDYHEISKRFYEGLTESDVRGITLVAEAKANPAIIDAYPGDKRFVGDQVLDDILGSELARDNGELKPGATVAHLAYYLARHLGCDPVILIGQDLGFTDNQYYAPGAAIHRVWGGELNEHNTIEMLEWQRIARMRSMLRRVPANGGGEIYADEQMATYLVQFERDFLDDTKRGLTVIDATEGGALKKHAICESLQNALDAIPPTTRFIAPKPNNRSNARRDHAVKARIECLRIDTQQLKIISGQTKQSLERMLEAKDDAELNRLIDRVQHNAKKVAELSTAHRLVQFINQAGQLNRYKADRAITLDETLSPREKQKRQIERDIQNVTWLADVSAHTESMLRDCTASLNGAPKVTRDADLGTQSEGRAQAKKKVVAVLITDSAMGGLGTARDPGAAFEDSTVIAKTLKTLSSNESITASVIVCRDEASIRSMIGDEGDAIIVRSNPTTWERRDRRARAIAAARVRASHCWRGGLANMTCYDEAFFAPMFIEAMDAADADAAVIVGPDWCEIDAGVLRATVDRYLENPERNKITFSQAPAGKGVCVISREIVQELCMSDGAAATIGGLLSYHPAAPQSDPIAKPQCVQIEASMRDMLGRFVADSHARRLKPGTAGPTMWNIRVTRDEAAVSANTWRALFASLVQSIEDVSIKIDGRFADERQIERLCLLARSEGVPHLQVVVNANASPRMFEIDANVISIDFGNDVSLETCNKWREALHLIEPVDGSSMPRRWFVPVVTRCDETLAGLEAWYDFWLAHRGVAVVEAPRSNPSARIQPMPIPDFVKAFQDSATVDISPSGVLTHRGTTVGELSSCHPLELLERIGIRSCETSMAEIAS